MAFNARARLRRLLAPLSLGATSLALAVSACSVPEFAFEAPPPAAVGGDGNVGSVCRDGFANCDLENGNACEVNTRTDARNCGACGNACDLPHATAECSGGVCRIQTDGCDDGYLDCDGDPENGCEVDLETNKLHCGACQQVCPDLNGTPSCAQGQCEISCDEGFEDCDGTRDNGCEVNLRSNSQSCNECGKVCDAAPGYSAYCKEGACGQTACSDGKGDCNGEPADGCEVTLTNDVQNCGGCGITCQAVNAKVACVSGACVISSCTGDFADCSGGYADGCETNTQSSPSDCGGCGNVCAVQGAHVTSNQCVDGQCNAQCSTNYLTCDNDTQNGCEADQLSDEANCGGCGTVCSSAPAAHVTSNLCQGGNCDPICAGTYRDCDASRTNGCEVDTSNNPSHCGGCDVACQTGTAAHVSSNPCSGGGCRPQCSGLYADCDKDGKNGCEKEVASDKANCGACGTVCGTTNASATTCSSGKCEPTCNSGWAKCATPEQGCVTRLGTTSHCAQCGQACTGSTPFCAGAGGCVGYRDIAVVPSGVNTTSGWIGNSSALAEIRLNHNLQTPRVDALGNANNRMVLVGVAATDNYTAMEKISVTYAGTPMLLAFEQMDPGKHSYAGIYYLLESGLPEAGMNRQVNVSIGAAMTWGHAGADVVELRNVMQVAPIATGGAGVDLNCSPIATRGASLSFSQAGSLVYGVLGARNATAAALVDNTVTQIANRQQTSPERMMLATAYVIANTSRTISWDVTGCFNTAVSLVAIKRLSAN